MRKLVCCIVVHAWAVDDSLMAGLFRTEADRGTARDKMDGNLISYFGDVKMIGS
jgi:hypothetical protein